MVRSVGLLASLTVVFALGVAAARAVADQPPPPPPPTQQAPAPQPRDPEPNPPAAEDLVARFTTRYEPGQPRVANIRRAAALLDGTRS